MRDRDTLTAVLNRWHTLQERWNDRTSARLQEQFLQPLGNETVLLEQQEEEIFRFVSLIEEELEELHIQS